MVGGNRSNNTLDTEVVVTAEEHGIERGLVYRVRYRAVNEIGIGTWSDIAYVRGVTLPLPPRSPEVTSFDDTKIDLSFSKTDDDGDSVGGAAFRYNLYCNEGSEGSAFHQIVAYDGTTLTFTINVGDAIGASGLFFALGKVYTVKMTSQNEVGESELRYHTPITRVALGRVPALPTQPVVDTLISNETTIKLDWAEPSPTDSLSPLRYLLYSDMGIPGNNHLIYNSSDLNILTFSHSNLSPGTLYSYWFQVENFNGVSQDLSGIPASKISRYACAKP